MNEHPVLTVLGALAALATIATFVFDIFPSPPDRVDPPSTDGFTAPCDDPTLSLSKGSGPAGTVVSVRGGGFPGDERVELRFHTEALVPARTDAEGTFLVDITVPGTFDAFAPSQFEISATTRPTICTSGATFRLTS